MPVPTKQGPAGAPPREARRRRAYPQGAMKQGMCPFHGLLAEMDMHARSTSPWMRIRRAARIHENPLDRKCVPPMGYLLNLIRAPSMASTKGAAAASEGGALRQVHHWNRGCIHTMGCLPNPLTHRLFDDRRMRSRPQGADGIDKNPYTLICDTHRHPSTPSRDDSPSCPGPSSC